MKQTLQPTIHDVRSECVLVQAWKKTVSDIRARSWYSDTLEIDYQSLRLPKFIAELQQRLETPIEWELSPLELTPAPKNQKWEINSKGNWAPANDEDIKDKMRPLAHVQLHDQVIATALMMCLADKVETEMADPRLPITKASNRKKILAYGHRLFCDATDEQGTLQHRWGSSKLYRQYYQDYRRFLERPNVVVESLKESLSDDQEIAVVHADLAKFYDRISPELVYEKVARYCDDNIEGGEEFKVLLSQFFDWRWNDLKRAQQFAEDNDVPQFNRVALPQGLTASGFFANIVLNDLEESIRATIGDEIPSSNVIGAIILEDACYYVDDLRFVLKVPLDMQEKDIAETISNWIEDTIDRTAAGLKIQHSKTIVTVEGRERRFLVEQSQSANRIQHEVSGTFDMLHGTELIGAIEGFFHTQKRYSASSSPEKTGRSGLLVGMSDMKDDTAARFAAGKFRRTYRSLRPLLEGKQTNQAVSEDEPDENEELSTELILSREQLDEKAKLFSALLIEEWTANPGNVRLLRVALDMYPDTGFLSHVLDLLRPAWASSRNSSKRHRREVGLYCLTEIFRAGATETGIVSDHECLPAGINIHSYHSILTKCAVEIFDAFIEAQGRKTTRHPWFLMQQVFLYLSTRNSFPKSLRMLKSKGGPLLQRHRQFAHFLNSEMPHSLEARALYLGIAVTAFGQDEPLMTVIQNGVSPDFLTDISKISPSLALQLLDAVKDSQNDDLDTAAVRLGLKPSARDKGMLPSLALRKKNPFYEEENLLHLANWLLSLPVEKFKETISPWQIRCKVVSADGYTFGKIPKSSFELKLMPQRMLYLFTPPDWCTSLADRRKYNIGLILRYAIRGAAGVLENSLPTSRARLPRYTKPTSHWEQQRYSTYQGRSSFGPPWLPISSIIEDILFEFLRWPGSGLSKKEKSLTDIKLLVKSARKQLKKNRGEFSSVTIINHEATWPDPIKKGRSEERPLRLGIVQSIIPSTHDFTKSLSDPELNSPDIRHRQRRHLSALIEGVTQMLRVRETHSPQKRSDGCIIDLLVFPELAIHPEDIDPIIIPFVRKHRCIVLFGQVYHPKFQNHPRPLINSALWLIPRWDQSSGLQIDRIEQGKQHLAPMERDAGFNPQPVGFRPAQWIIRYHWHRDSINFRPINLSASICYDATDLSLAADLKSRSDLYIVCALNKDVGTFDRMSEGLHYHMFQGVVIVNNGQFGGSNFFMPFKNPHHRQVFHLHGQPQASISFAEIAPRKLINRPDEDNGDSDEDNGRPAGKWKSPPASWTPPSND